MRSECEAAIAAAGLNATILRPWYVLSPGRWWPYLMLPAYKIAEWLPATREEARRLGLVTLEQMTSALTVAVEKSGAGAARDRGAADSRGARLKSRANQGFWPGVTFARTKVTRNYQRRMAVRYLFAVSCR